MGPVGVMEVLVLARWSPGAADSWPSAAADAFSAAAGIVGAYLVDSYSRAAKPTGSRMSGARWSASADHYRLSAGTLAIASLSRSLENYRRGKETSTGGPHASQHLLWLPPKPDPFTAHPYSLLQTSRVIGRSDERVRLDGWFRAGDDGHSLLFLVAMGGMGKSALTWRWYSETIGDRDQGLNGAIWWSFYESDAGYERFVTRCCAYLSGRPEEHIQEAELSEREELLLSLLDRERFLVVLDGAERLVRAYATLDATYIHDDALDEQTAHAIASGEPVSRRNADDFYRRRRLREFTDHRAARLFNRMRFTRRSRVLVSSRLFPSSLENDGAQPLPGCEVVFLRGMSTTDAIELWREFGATGCDTDLAEVFEQLGNFPLAIRTLAGTVAQFRPAPGDFTRWREHNPKFLSTDADLRRSTRHVLRYALADLGAGERQVLRILAAFRMPVDWQVLVDVVGYLRMGGGDESVLADCLQSLEDRGLMGWDQGANRYDLHPIVRLSTWNATPESDRLTIMSAVYEHYSRQLAEEQRLGGAGRLNTQVEAFYALSAMGRHSDAYTYFAYQLYELTLHAESLVRVHLELIEQFFPNGLKEAPVFEDAPRRGRLHRWLTYAHMMAGEPGAAAELTVGGLRPEWLSEARPNWRELYFAFAECGRLREAEAALAVMFLGQSAVRGSDTGKLATLSWLAYQLDRRGAREIADKCAELYRTLTKRAGLDMVDPSDEVGVRRLVRDQLMYAERLLDRGMGDAATQLLDQVESRVDGLRRTREKMRLLQLRGRAEHLGGRLAVARRHLEEALLLTRSRAVVGLEMVCLVELARVARDDGRTADALDHLRDVYEPARRGPYPMEEADARGLAAEIARESGDRSTAVTEARAAYVKAWCDGPPYAYASGLRSAESVLSRYGADAPSPPVFDQARFVALPTIFVAASGDINVSADVDSDNPVLLERFLEIGRSMVTRTPTPLGHSGE
jgi:tetratricopeptide (TPR) repeat protein